MILLKIRDIITFALCIFFLGFLFGACIMNRADDQKVESENNKVEVVSDNYSNK